MAQKFSKSFYNSKEWEQVRGYVLMRDKFLCTKCGSPAEEVHHIIHLTPANIFDITITLNPKNLTSLCKACHFEEHRGEHAGGRAKQEQTGANQYEFDENGMLVKKNSPPIFL